MAENPMMKRAQVAMVEEGAVLWRNNVGVFLQGKQRRIKEGGLITVSPGDVVLSRPRTIRCGLDVGSSDLIGLTPVVVTPAMVGKTIAVFTSPEAKDIDGVVEPEQASWIAMVNDNGGISFVFRSEIEGRQLLRQAINRITT